MNVYLRIDINIAAIVLLGFVLWMAYNRLDKMDLLNKKFINTSMIIIIEILIETITCILNGRPEQGMIHASNFMHICLYVTAAILTYCCYTFIYSWIMPRGEIPIRRKILLLIPVALNSVITVLSPMYGFVFYINSSNEYQRGPYFYLSGLIIYFYLVISLVLIIKQRKKIIKQEFVPLFLVGLLPILGGIVQTLFYGVLLMWSSVAFSLVIIYNFLQQRMIHLDTLTGAWTRESFDYYLSQRIKQRDSFQFGAIFMDLDGLKQINDEYGHLEGDCAIKSTVQLVKGLLRKTDIIARLGGDEFVIILECKSKEVLDKMIERINACFAQFNETSKKQYTLECSFGADMFHSKFHTVEQFLNHVDYLMYKDKKRKS